MALYTQPNCSTRGTTLIWTTVGIGISIAGYFYYRNWRSAKHSRKTHQKLSSVLPTYATVGEVKHIYLYALDGGHPIEVDKAFCAGGGLQYKKERGEIPIEDRSFVVYTVENKLCYTTNVKLVTVCLSKDYCFELETKNGGKKLKIQSGEINRKEIVTVNYLDSELKVYDCGHAAARFLSEHLLDKHCGLRLGQFTAPLIRKNLNQYEEITSNPILDQRYLLECMKPELNNFSLISDGTIDHIKNMRGCGQVTPQHFRAHVVVALGNGTNPWQRPFIEDQFEEITIGSASFRNVTLRTIDKFVNIDPQTGIPSKNDEPFENLKRMRPARSLSEQLYDEVETPVLGINMGIEQTGVIRVGDSVKVKFQDFSRVR